MKASWGICRAMMFAPSLLHVRSDESLLLFPKDLFLCRHKLLLIIFFFSFYFSFYDELAIDGFCHQYKETNNTYYYAAERKVTER